MDRLARKETPAAELKGYGRLCRHLRKIAARLGLPFLTVKKRWYSGRRGESLEAPRYRRVKGRNPTRPRVAPAWKTDMYVDTWFGSFNVSRREAMKPWKTR